MSGDCPLCTAISRALVTELGARGFYNLEPVVHGRADDDDDGDGTDARRETPETEAVPRSVRSVSAPAALEASATHTVAYAAAQRLADLAVIGTVTPCGRVGTDDVEEVAVCSRFVGDGSVLVRACARASGLTISCARVSGDSGV